MCQTVTETLPKQNVPSKPEQPTCPADCPCRQQSSPWTLQLLFNVLGILFAVFATYMMIATDSNLYLIFWLCYSVLRRMMGKSRQLKMKKE